MRKAFDLSIYFIVDPSCCNGRNVVDVVVAAVRGGATMIQYRDKGAGDSLHANQILHNSERIKQALDMHANETGNYIPFLINDYPEIALEIGADGVHIGQGDVSPQQARAILGDDAIIGLTAFTAEHMSVIAPSVVDYVGTGPVYPTKTDKGKPVMGADRFADIAALSPVPVVGIGGITPDNAGVVINAGANGVAMMRAISAADDPENAARDFVDVVAR